MQITDITPYLPFYLGCEGEYIPPDGIGYCDLWKLTPEILINIAERGYKFIPHLRPFDQFTVDDLKGWIAKLNELGFTVPNPTNGELKYECERVKERGLKCMDLETHPQATPHLIAYLCSREIDVFGLIPSGLAKIKKEEGK